MIIGISGKKETGKNEVANIIQYLQVEDQYKNYNEFKKQQKKETIDSDFEVKSFAHKLKQVVSIITGCSMEDLEDQYFKESLLDESWSITEEEYNKIPFAERYMYLHLCGTRFTYRELLQVAGDALRNVNPNVWINALYCDYKEDSKWIVPDVRFPNEAISVKKRDGLLLRVIRNTGKNDQHASEVSLDNYDGFDYVIENNASLPKLVKEVKKILIKEGLL